METERKMSQFWMKFIFRLSRGRFGINNWAAHVQNIHLTILETHAIWETCFHQCEVTWDDKTKLQIRLPWHVIQAIWLLVRSGNRTISNRKFKHWEHYGLPRQCAFLQEAANNFDRKLD